MFILKINQSVCIVCVLLCYVFRKQIALLLKISMKNLLYTSVISITIITISIEFLPGNFQVVITQLHIFCALDIYIYSSILFPNIYSILFSFYQICLGNTLYET